MEMYRDCCYEFVDKGDGKAWLFTRWGHYFPMPKRWAEKVIELLKSGNINKACHYIDLAERRA